MTHKNRTGVRHWRARRRDDDSEFLPGEVHRLRPLRVLRLDPQDGKAVVAYPDDCVACWGCESFCPAGVFDVAPDRGRGEMASPY